jgi:hypothetical protein
MAKTFRVFIAHSKTDQDLDGLVAQVRRVLAPGAQALGRDLVLVLGRDDHAAEFKRAGGWEAWARDVAHRVHPVTREPFYNAILVPGGPGATVGKATAQIVLFSLSVGKKVVGLGQEHGLWKVRAVETVDGDDFKAGWRLAR